jgi:2,4-dienoyl-CoA reductase-like NADH-dependent reductase (Old Yellow Enzyme family)
MNRSAYKIFSPGRIGELRLPNRIVRSATWDPAVILSSKMNAAVLDVYRRLAEGGVGMIITGGFIAYQDDMLAPDGHKVRSFAEIRVEGIEQLVRVVRAANPECRLIAQLETGTVSAQPSTIPSPWQKEIARAFTTGEVEGIIACFVEAIGAMQAEGFDGVQLHAAHGGLLSRFLSPYSNRRQDAYGGSVEKRVRIVREIVEQARKSVGSFPILIKANCTDYVAGGLDIDGFPQQARALERAGVDAIEISGGLRESLLRTEAELGFRPVPSPEGHTHLNDPAKQSYFLPFAEALDLNIPLILVGGNKDVERLEEILQRGRVGFVALCRPLLKEPDLPQRWLEGRGKSRADCISCNSCLYNMRMLAADPQPRAVQCLYRRDKAQYQAAQEWLTTWVEKNRVEQE